MTAKEYLHQAIKISKSIQAKHELIIKLREQATSITASYTTEMVSSSPQNKIETIVVKIEQLRGEIIEDSERLINVQRDIYQAISNLDDNIDKIILTQKYLLNKTWEQICWELGYSWRGIHKRHSIALIKIKECMEVHTTSVLYCKQ